MSVAAYGSLVSLLQVLDQIQKHHAWGRIRLDTQQVQNFKGKIQFLQEFLELPSQKLSKEDIEGLAPRITDAAREAEIIIDRHVVDQLRGLYDDENDKGISAFRAALEDVVQVMDTIKEGLINKIQFVQRKRKRPPLSIHSDPSIHSVPTGESSHDVMMSTEISSTFKSSERKASMVGSEELINKIVDKLTNEEKSLQVISVVGMGGIGKTTLAKCIFEDSRIVKRFDRRKWSTITQKYDEREVIKCLLGRESNEEMSELGVQLHQELTGRRYLIVIDDIWSIEVLDRLKLYFPDNSNGSRVILTTRLLYVAEYSESRNSYELDFLSDAESWDLFCEKTFGQQSCPTNLEKFGKKVALSCRGLPISIVTIGGLLSKSDMSPEYWEYVANNAKEITSSEDDERCMKILYLSYDNLPIHLKLCFLDFANYLEHEHLISSVLISNWIHLGLVKSVPGQRIEDTANGYLNDLAERNLIFFSRGYHGLTKTEFYGIHDLLRELCNRESQLKRMSEAVKREILLHGKECKRSNFVSVRDQEICFMCGDASEGVDLMEMVPAPRSNRYMSYNDSFWLYNWLVWGDSPLTFCGRCKMEYSHLLLRSRWVTLLEHTITKAQVRYTTTELRYPTQSRMLYYYSSWMRFRSPSSILFMWNLQTIDITPQNSNTLSLPMEIWEMQQIRNLIAPGYVLPDPVIVIGEKEFTVLEELQTLDTHGLRLTRAIFERMPNLREMNISATDDIILFFTQLESLTIFNGEIRSIIFPPSLKKLHLDSCDLCCEDMDVIGSLSDLHVLVLKLCKFEDYVWTPSEEKFLQLRVLIMCNLNLNHWEAEQDHFPKLERLCWASMHGMEEIPSDIANIQTLVSIDLIGCSQEIIESAKKILEEQQDLGNWDLKIYVE